GRRARPASRAEGVDRQVQGTVRPGLGQGARGNPRPADQARRRSSQHPADQTAGGHSRLGQLVRRPEAPLRAHGYAGYLAYADCQIGRRIDAVQESGQLDNTPVIYIQGDNGASAEGSLQGTTNEVATAANGVQESIPFLLSMIDELGGPKG